MSTKPDPDYALSQQIKTEARSLPDFIEWAVAALIAEEVLEEVMPNSMSRNRPIYQLRIEE